MRKILVTGGAGFIGSTVVRSLINENNQIILPVLKNEDLWRVDKIKDGVHLVECDLNDFESIDGLVKDHKPEYVLHLATKGVYTREWSDRIKILKGNYGMTVNLLEAINKYHSATGSFKHFINTGSVFEYGTTVGKVSEDTVSLGDNLNEYSSSKKATTSLTLTYGDKFPVTVLRPFTAYGPYGDKSRFIESSIIKALKGEPIAIAENVIRDFIFVEDIAQGYIKTIESEKAFNKVINIGSGRAIKLKDVAKIIVKITGSDSEIVVDNSFKREKDSRCWADITKAKNTIDWQPEISIEKGISEMVEFVKLNKTYYLN